MPDGVTPIGENVARANVVHALTELRVALRVAAVLGIRLRLDIVERHVPGFEHMASPYDDVFIAGEVPKV